MQKYLKYGKSVVGMWNALNEYIPVCLCRQIWTVNKGNQKIENLIIF